MTVRERWARQARAGAVAALALGAGGGLLLPALLSASAPASAATASANAVGACTHAPENCAGLAVSPTTPAAGDTVTFTFALTNAAAKADDGAGTTAEIRSVELSVPAGFLVEGAVSPGSVATTPTTVTFDNLAIPVGGTAKLTVTAAVPCGEAAGAATNWGFVARDTSSLTAAKNDDNFALDPAGTAALTGSITGECSLGFAAGPGGTTAATPLTAGFDSHGGPVQVQVLSATGSSVAGFAGAVSVGLAAGPAGSTLGGRTTEQAGPGSGGASVASFSDLTLSEAGPGYQLEATGTNLQPGRSSDFSIYQTIAACSASTCADSSTSPGVVANLRTASAEPGGFLASGFGGVNLACAGYDAVTEPLDFSAVAANGVATSTSGVTATLEISKALVRSSGREGVAHWQICFASTRPFVAQGGHTTSTMLRIGGTTYYTGLLARCSPRTSAPCIVSRTKTRAGQVLLTVRSTGDPIFRG